jgi:large subunit ribosomal protein L33
MAKAKGAVLMAFVCGSCGRWNYYLPVTKSKTNKLSLKKYCRQCKRAVLHKATKMPITKPSAVKER